jgi:hypothetical protein
MAHCEIPLKRGGPSPPTALHGSLDLKLLPLDKAKAIADCLENQFTPHDLCDENRHGWRLQSKLFWKL